MVTKESASSATVRQSTGYWLLRKVGDDCIATLEGWSTTFAEDEAAMLKMMEVADVINLTRILAFRIKMKKAYAQMPKFSGS
jgi:hypothetical protein